MHKIKFFSTLSSFGIQLFGIAAACAAIASAAIPQSPQFHPAGAHAPEYQASPIEEKSYAAED